MTRLFLLAGLLLGLFGGGIPPALAQEGGPEQRDTEGAKAPVEDHAREEAAPGDHGGQADRSAATRAKARPVWSWALLGLLLAGAIASPKLLARRPRRTRAAVSAGCLALAVALLGFGRPTPPPDQEQDHKGHDEVASNVVEVDPEALDLAGIDTTTVTLGGALTTLQTTGRIVAVESRVAHLSPRISGRVTAVRVRVGEYVRAGQAVGSIDSVETAQAAAAYREAAAEFDLARRNLATRRELAASGSFTAAPLEAARQQLAVARLQLAEVESEQGQAENEAEAARAALVRTRQLAESGTFTGAEEEKARRELADAEAALNASRQEVANAEADLAAAHESLADALAQQTAAEGEVSVTETRLANARTMLERAEQLAATGELDHAPLELAENNLATARARQQEIAADLEQARQQLRRGEELYEATLISLNDLGQRRATVAGLEARAQEAAGEVRNAAAALARQRAIYESRLNTAQAVLGPQGEVASGEKALTAARGRVIRARARVEAARSAVSAAEQRVATAKSAIPPAQRRVDAARALYEREASTARQGTRAEAAIATAELRVRQAERTVKGKQAEVAEARNQVEVAQAAYDREQQLYEGRVRAREQLIGAERAVKQAEIQVRNYADILNLLGASATQASRSRGRIEVPIIAPTGGLITQVHMSLGETVGPESELVTVADLDEVYVEADVYEPDLRAIRQGQTVHVRVRSYPDQVFSGPVVSSGGSLDPETRTAKVRARLVNPDHRLRPEMFATVAFETGDADRVALTVPEAAVQTIEGDPVVFVERGKGRYVVQPVRLGEVIGDRVIVLDGLEAGDQVVTAGSYLLKSEHRKGELGEGHAD